jgi:hypothetical protein
VARKGPGASDLAKEELKLQTPEPPERKDDNPTKGAILAGRGGDRGTRTPKPQEVIEHYLAIPRHYDSKLQKETVFFETEAASRASPPLKLSRDRKYTLSFVPKQHLVKFFLAFAKATATRIDFSESHVASEFLKALDEQDLKPTEMRFVGRNGITGSISTEAKTSTFASLFLLEILLSADCKLGRQDLCVLVPTKGKILAGEGVDTVSVVIPVEVH